LPRLNASVATVVAGHNFARHAPVLVTLADEGYEEFLAPWASKSGEMGFTQKFVVALAPSTFALCENLSLPSVLVDTDSLNLSQAESLRAVSASSIPGQVPFAKFGVPYVLLQMGFDSVVLSEMDVFFFASPLPMLQDVRSRRGAPVLAMPDEKDIVDKSAINIGFMMLGRGSELLLLKFLDVWWNRRSADLEVAVDQTGFQEIAAQFLAEGTVQIELLDTRFFAVRPRDITSKTVVLHLAWSLPECKLELLESLYQGQPRKVVRQRVLDKKIITWADC